MQQRTPFSTHRFGVSAMAGKGSLTNRHIAPWKEKGNARDRVALLPQVFRRSRYTQGEHGSYSAGSFAFPDWSYTGTQAGSYTSEIDRSVEQTLTANGTFNSN